MEDKTPFQQILGQAYLDYCDKQGKRRVSDNEFARWLDVSPASFNQWVNGNREPSFENAARLAAKLGPQVFYVLGYERADFVSDPQLKEIIKNWDLLSQSSKTLILELVKAKAQEK